MNYIKWNEQDSRYIKGLVICELPPITKPQMRVAETVVDGVDGSVIEELGYATYDKALSIGITQKANIDQIIKFFSGTGEVVFSNEPDKFYKATIINQIDYARLVRFRTATVVFRVQPFKYEYDEQTVTLTESGSIFNDGNYIARPIIEIKGTGTVELTVNDNTVFSYTFPDGDDAVVIDSQKQDAYVGTILKNRNMVGEFPAFEIGANTISWEGNITSLSVSYKSRWL
jgi:predicted phage tail component-like protein